MLVDERVEIDGQGVSRDVKVFDAYALTLLTIGQSDTNGDLQVTVPDGTDSLLFLAEDNHGLVFIGNHLYQPGERVRVEGINEFRYEVYLEGVSDINPPSEWPQQEGDLVVSGTVTFKCVRFYRPVVKFRSL